MKRSLRPDTHLTTYQAAAFLQVNPSTVNNWASRKLIRVFRTPGGHRRMRADDLVRFMMKHEMPIPEGLVAASPKP